MIRILRQRKRILLLDDDSSIQRLVSVLMRRQGYAVDVVSDAAQALSKMRRRAYDALLLDVMTPTQGAMTVIRHLREKQPEMLRRVVLVTASPDSVVRSLQGDVFAIVRKPFEPAELTAVVSRALAA